MAFFAPTAAAQINESVLNVTGNVIDIYELGCLLHQILDEDCPYNIWRSQEHYVFDSKRSMKK